PGSLRLAAEQQQLGCVLRVLERKIAAVVEPARAEQPQQFARRRREAAMTRAILVGITLALSVTIAAQTPAQRTFASPDEAVQALVTAAKASDVDALRAIFGPESQELIASSDPATARMNRKVFAAAYKERHNLADEAPDRKTLVIGNEDWPFPVPIVKEGNTWRFDTAAGKEEIIARRIGRNELAAIDTCRAYVTAQQRYAAVG